MTRIQLCKWCVCGEGVTIYITNVKLVECGLYLRRGVACGECKGVVDRWVMGQSSFVLIGFGGIKKYDWNFKTNCFYPIGFMAAA